MLHVLMVLMISRHFSTSGVILFIVLIVFLPSIVAHYVS